MLTRGVIRLSVPAVLCGLCLLMAGGPASVGSSDRVSRADGGSIRTELGHGIVLNDGSTLTREWIAVDSPSLPAHFVSTPGVVTRYEQDRLRGSYEYNADMSVNVTTPLSAIEIKFITFDVWGTHRKSLSLTEIKDIAIGTIAFSGQWSIFSENEASEYYASIAYIARVRTIDGRVLEADIGPVLAEAKKFSAKFTESDLEPAKPK